MTGVLRSWFSPVKTRAILAGKRQIWGYPLASLLGVLTPFWLLLLGAALHRFSSRRASRLASPSSFLIAGPMVGPVGLGLLYGLVGWEIATIYLVFGFTIATVAGFVLGRMGLERYLQDWVRRTELRSHGRSARRAADAGGPASGSAWNKCARLSAGSDLGARRHRDRRAHSRLRPRGDELRIMGRGGARPGGPFRQRSPWAFRCIPNAAGVIPIVEALLGKGAALGTTLAFMMSVIALSLPEMIILKQVLTLAPDRDLRCWWWRRVSSPRVSSSTQ